jgi:hypothetical protein
VTHAPTPREEPLIEPHYALFETYISNLNAIWKDNADMIRFVFEDWEKVQSFVSPVTIYYLEAVRCFLSSNYVGSIAASSASVEIAVNNENRKRGWRRKPDNWLGLWDCLKLAKKHDLPGDKLLASGFALTRDKFDHGDIFPFISQTLGLADSGGNPNFAVEQLRLAHDFLIALYNPEQ